MPVKSTSIAMSDAEMAAAMPVQGDADEYGEY